MTFDANPVLTVLIVQSARAAVLILAILLLRFFVGKRIPPAWRHAIWGLVPLQLLLVVSVPSSISLFNLFSAQSDVQIAEPTPDTQPDVVPEIVFDNFDATPDENISTFTENELAAIANALAQPDPDPEIGAATVMERSKSVDVVAETTASGPEVVLRSPSGSLNNSKPDIPISTLLLVVWGVGCLVMIVVFVRQIVRCRRWVARGKPVTSEPVLQLFEESCRRMKIKTWLVVASSAMVRGPFLIGAIRPKLLLPHRMVESASPKQLQAVFLHELAHLKRWDIWTGWLMTLLLIVHWFNPLLWIAIRRMNADREEACDVMAMNTLDRLQQGDYAHALLDIAQQFVGPTHAPGLVGISETGKFLKRRIDMLKQIGTWKLRWKVLAVGLALLIAAVTLTDAQEKKETKPKPGNIVVDGVEYAPVTKDETKPQPREEESRSIAGRYESDGSYVDLISVMPGAYKINMTKKSDGTIASDENDKVASRMYEGVASRNGDQMRVEFLSCQKVTVTSIDGQTIPQVRQGPVPDSLQSLTIDIKQDVNGMTSLAFPETDQWKAFEVSLAEPEIVPRDLNGGFRGTIDGKTFVMDLIAVYNSRKIPPDYEYHINIYSADFKDSNAGSAWIQEETKSLNIKLKGKNLYRFGLEEQSFDMAIDKDDSGTPVLTVKSDPAPENFPLRLTKITTNAQWQEIEELQKAEEEKSLVPTIDESMGPATAIQPLSHPPQDESQQRVMVYRLLNMNAGQTAETLKALMPNAGVLAEVETNSLIIFAKPEEIEIIRNAIQQIDKTPEAETDETLSIAVYNLSAADAQTALPVLQTALKRRPDVRLTVDQRTNSIIVYGRKADHEEAEKVLEQLDKTPARVEYGVPMFNTNIPLLNRLFVNTQVKPENPGVNALEGVYAQAPSDPVVGKYLATRVDGRQTGVELTRIEYPIAPSEIAALSKRMPRSLYRIVMYDDVTGLSGLDFTKAENQHRVIGTATLEGNTLTIDCEVEHDGERYQPVEMNLKSGKLVRDGEALLISFECEIRHSGGTDFFVAEKVVEPKPAESSATPVE